LKVRQYEEIIKGAIFCQVIRIKLFDQVMFYVIWFYMMLRNQQSKKNLNFQKVNECIFGSGAQLRKIEVMILYFIEFSPVKVNVSTKSAVF
jgi:hypothetical protein